MKIIKDPYYFDNNGHLTDEAVAQTVEAMLKTALRNDLPEEVARHLSDCEHCNERATELYMDLKDEQDIIMALAGKEVKPKSRKTYSRLLIKIAAAILILIVGAGAIFLLQKPSPDKLFSDYFEAYPNIVTMKSEANNNFSTAMLYYELKEWDSAIFLLEKYMDVNGAEHTATFYAGVASLANGQTDKAIFLLKQLSVENNKFNHQAKWYLALAYLKENDPVVSLQYLQSLIESDNYYRGKSIKLMKKIR